MKSSRAQVHARFKSIPRLSFSEEGRLTSYAGLVPFMVLFNLLDLRARIRRCFSHVAGQRIFGHSAVAMLLVVHLLLGFRRLRGLAFYRDDPIVKRVLGLRDLPNVATVSRTLKEVDDRAIEKYRDMLRDLVADRIRKEGFTTITLDFDGSVQSTGGHAEGTAIGFNKKKRGARSYYPLFCTVAQTGQFYDVLHRPGNVHDSNGAASFMLDCFFNLMHQLDTARFEARFDAAFFSEEIIALMQQIRVEFTCSVPFERLPELKSIIEHRKRWKRINGEWSFFEPEWSPKSWEGRCRHVVARRLRKERRDGPLQLHLFEPLSPVYEYTVIATNRRGSARSVLLFHHGRGAQEKLFGEAKQHAALDLIPTRTLRGNQLFTLSGMMAHNLGRELQMAARPAQSIHLAKRTARWVFNTLGTIRQRMLHRAGMLSWPQGCLTLTMSANEASRQEMLSFMKPLEQRLRAA